MQRIARLVDRAVMGQGLRLQLRQTQQLVMTPQLQQAIRLLQMNNLELADYVDREVEGNPLLERAAPDGADADDGAPDPAPPPPGAATDRELRRNDPAGIAEKIDTGAENLFDGEMSAEDRRTTRLPDAAFAEGPGLEERLRAEPTLREHLLAQLGQFRAEPMAGRVARVLVDLLDDHGYLRERTDELAHRLEIPPDAFDAGLALLQRCDPAGVGARSLAECLALQLAERDRLDPAMRRMTENLDMVARAEHRRLRQICGVDAEDYEDMLAELRALDPFPCSRFGTERAETLIPDVLLTRDPQGGWRVELNPETMPRVLMNERYAARLSERGTEIESWLSERRAEANWLIRSLDQRARTILKISSEIVRQQARFFEIGIAGLRPLTLRMVAEETGLHESTASRVTSNKYIATERGIFELKFFFTNAVGGAGGESDAFAAEAVRHRIRALVDGEASGAILSDDAIVEILGREGIDLARRTVAKYRKVMNIPSSVDRRRLKAARR